MKKKKLSYRNDPGFSVPSNYFEELERDLLDMVQHSESEKVLNNIEGSGFKVPESYFESFEVKLPGNASREPKIIPLFKKEYMLYAASIAAIIIALTGSLYINPAPVDTWENIELSVLENYIDDNNIDLTTTEISGFLFNDGIVVDDSNFNEVNSEAMLDYLEENVEDPTFILE
ncbi:MAG: hypothetical protein RI572_01665 [Salegentibacter sp.]|uniref:hypothetical protein n=1 Tax=Salegentibacter sp. TaxID=1903072 RepID=UPI00286FBBCF|nr:hypothetical protein [Salegentibacter sp.]MDR9456091.1 hypothetical protein [Salegentibacter sp.]